MRLRWYFLVVGLLGLLVNGWTACGGSDASPAGAGGVGGWGGDAIGGLGIDAGNVGGPGVDAGNAGVGYDGGLVDADRLGLGGSDGARDSSIGSSAEDTCKQTVAAICGLAFACGGGRTLTQQYASAAECTTALGSISCTAAQVACGPGQTYHADLAHECIAGFQTESCADYAMGVEPAACSLVCSGGLGGMGGVGGIGGWGGEGGIGGWGGEGGIGGWGDEGGIGGWGGWGDEGGIGGWGGWGGEGGIGGRS